MLEAGFGWAAVTPPSQLRGQFSLLLTKTLYYTKDYLHF